MDSSFYFQNLMRHMRYECGLPPRFPCHVCGRFFRRKDDLHRHVSRIHGILDGAAAILLAAAASSGASANANATDGFKDEA